MAVESKLMTSRRWRRSHSGVLDALAARVAAYAERVIAGTRRGAEALSLPVLGGHTQLGAPAALAVTGSRRAIRPVAAGSGASSHEGAPIRDLRPGLDAVAELMTVS